MEAFNAGGSLAFGGMEQLSIVPGKVEYTNDSGVVIPAIAA